MKKIRKKGIAIVLSLLMVLLAACAGNDPKTGGGNTEGANNGTSGDATGSGDGSYVEQEYSLPEEDSIVFAMNTLSDGSIRLVTGAGVYDSRDGGESWEKQDLFHTLYEQDKGIMAAGIDKEGNVLLARQEETGIVYHYINRDGVPETLEIALPEPDFGGAFGGEPHTFQVGEEDEEMESQTFQALEMDPVGPDGAIPEKEETDAVMEDEANEEMDAVMEDEAMEGGTAEKKLDTGEKTIAGNATGRGFSNSLMKISFTDDGNIVGNDMMGGLYIIDAASGEILHTLSEPGGMDSVDGFVCVGGTLVVSTKNGIDLYDLATGNLLEPEEALSNYFVPAEQEDGGRTMKVSVGGAGELVMTAGSREGEFFMLDETGIHRYVLGTDTVEEIVEGSQYSMAAPGYYYQGLAAKEDGSFLVVYQEMGNASMNTKLMNYTYDENASAVPKEEITIYTLQDNQNIRQAISQFKKSHPDCKVNLTVGRSEGDAVTVSDALRSLNTDILAGKGPDILLLDGMPVDSYIEKGLLYDLSETISAVASDSEYFTQVLYANKTEDGLYAIPTRFSIPVLAGKAEQVQAAADLAALAQTVEKLRQEDPEIHSILGTYTGEQMVGLLYSAASVSMIQEDGTLHEEKLTEFLTLAKNIYENNGAEDSNTDEMEMKEEDILRNLQSILSGQQLLEVNELGGISDFNTIVSVNKEVDWNYSVIAGQPEPLFIPRDTIGVSAKSDNMETSLEFVKELLSVDMQKISQSPGFPVNADSFDELCQEQLNTDEKTASAMIAIMKEDGDMVQLSINPGTEEEYGQLKGYLETVGTSANTNDIIKSAVIKEASDCMQGITDIPDAVKNIIQTINIYLAE